MDVGEFVQKESIKIFITSSDRFDAVVREKGVKMAVVSSLGELEDLGSVKKNKRIKGGYGSGKGPRERL